jgi:hypothetical protein
VAVDLTAVAACSDSGETATSPVDRTALTLEER